MILRNVRAHYSTDHGPVVRAVDGVSFSVGEGEVLGIVGESGCGKSTLASVISLTARPPLHVTSGEMILDGDTIALTDQTDIPQDWHGRKVSLLPQRAMNSLNPTARVRDFVVDVVRAHDATVTPQEAIDRALERLEQLSLPSRVLDSYPHQLSGGMRQRVVAVVSTLLDPGVLIADEPTSALDVSSQKELVLLLQLLLERGFIRRVIYITHDLPILSNIAERIAVMYAGEIVEIDETKSMIRSPQHPYTQALIGSTLDPDPHLRGSRLQGIRGAPPDLRNPPSGCRFHPRCPYVMEICTREAPPLVGDPDHFSACWWVQQQLAGKPFEKAEA
ncbi:MAG: ABC transporter ATP-binding protein [Chloroflexi bacterium]|nr:MAG: ABC transporter ATP-binding protein [Chloroflexota bacterium]